MLNFILLVAFSCAFCNVGADRCAHHFSSDEARQKFNKQVVLDFYRESFSDVSKVEAGVRKYVVPEGYIQHDPNVADGVDAMVEFQLKFFANLTGPSVEFIAHIAAEEDFVWVHELDSLPNNRSIKFVVFNLFRLECGKFVEHWDVTQIVDPNAVYANSLPYF